METVISAALLSLVAASSLWALSLSNQMAALSRLSTGAQVAAQNEIDLLISTGPFNPQKGEFGADRPNQFAPNGASIVMPRPLALGQTPERDIIIYEEPAVEGEPPRQIHGKIVTAVTATGIDVSGRSLNAYSAAVTVTYSYRGREHTVELYTVRASDVDGT